MKGGNALATSSKSMVAPSFNEAALHEGRKSLGKALMESDDEIPSMRPPFMKGGNEPKNAAIRLIMTPSMRPPFMKGGNSVPLKCLTVKEQG